MKTSTSQRSSQNNDVTTLPARRFCYPNGDLAALFMCLLCCQTYSGHTCHIRRHDYPPGLHFNQSKALVPVCCCVNPIKEGLFPPVSLSRSHSPPCSTPSQSWGADRARDPAAQSTQNSTQHRGFPHWCGKLILSKSTGRRNEKCNGLPWRWTLYIKAAEWQLWR